MDCSKRLGRPRFQQLVLCRTQVLLQEHVRTQMSPDARAQITVDWCGLVLSWHLGLLGRGCLQKRKLRVRMARHEGDLKRAKPANMQDRVCNPHTATITSGLALIPYLYPLAGSYDRTTMRLFLSSPSSLLRHSGSCSLRWRLRHRWLPFIRETSGTSPLPGLVGLGDAGGEFPASAERGERGERGEQGDKTCASDQAAEVLGTNIRGIIMITIATKIILIVTTIKPLDRSSHPGRSTLLQNVAIRHAVLATTVVWRLLADLRLI